MRDRNFCDRYSTELEFTQANVSKAIEELKEYASTSENIRYKDVWNDEFTGNKDWDKHMHLWLPLKRSLNKQLDEIYGDFVDQCEEKIADNVDIVWHLSEDEKYYELEIGGRELCSDFYNFQKEAQSCSCPETFTKTCKDIRAVLKKYATETEKI